MAIDDDLADGFLQHNQLTREFGTHTHLGLNKDTPLGRPVHDRGTITPMPKLGGLHHTYIRI
jgi:hypothetical protein